MVRLPISEVLALERGVTLQPSVRILIVDDHPEIRRALRRLLSLEQGWQVCAEAADGLEAIDATREHKPDFIIMDLSMPHMSGIRACAEIRKEFPAILIMILTSH